MMVDFHTHILPGADDGSCSVQESIRLIEMQKRQGIQIIVATPHFYPDGDSPHRFLQRRQNAYEKLMAAVSKSDGFPEIVLGAEVYYFSGISQWDGLKDMCIGDTEFVLLEMPMGKWTDRMYREIDGIYTRQGLVPVIAHLDRYINIFNANNVIEHLGKMNVAIQANADFFIRKTRRKLALKLLKGGIIDVLGSDCHNIDTRKPNLQKAEEIIVQNLGWEYIDYINHTGEKILSIQQKNNIK